MAKSIRHNEVNSIEDLMKILIKEYRLTKGLRQVDVEKIWANQMGKGVKNYTSKVVLNKGTLTVYLTSSVLREELSFGKDKIITMLNEALGETVIKQIRLL